MRNDKGSHSQRKNSNDDTKSRKQLRKEKKIQKKEKKRLYFQNRSQSRHDTTPQPPKSMHQPTKSKPKTPIFSNKQVINKEKDVKIALVSKKTIKRKQPIETEDDKMIRLFQQKLGIAQGKDKYGKIAKKYGFDDDIFDFLDGISQKVQNTGQYQQQQDAEQVSGQEPQEQQIEEEEEEEEEGYGQQLEGEFQQQEEQANQEHFQDQQNIEQEGNQEDEEFDQKFDRMFDNLDQVEPGMQAEEFQQQQIHQEVKPKRKQKKNKKNQLQPSQKQKYKKSLKVVQQISSIQGNQPKFRPNFLTKSNDQNPEKPQIKKSINSLFNKLSDGNVLLTFRELLKILQSHPKSLVIPIFAELFTKFNLMIEKPLFHILATNVALLAALHYAIGNRFIAPVLQNLTQKYLQINAQEQNQLQVTQLGYSKRFERLKNYATIVSLLYNYGSITGQFIETYVGWLVDKMNKSNIELIYIVVQKCGMHIRQKDPSTLKTVIGLVKGAIDVLKRQPLESEEQQQKVNFIELQLNEIRFNKKSQNAIDQRMAFLQTFINKNVKKEIEREKEVFPLSFQALMNIRNEQLSRTNWWESNNQFNQHINDYQDGNNQQQINEVVKQKNRLFQLAKSFHLVTETKRNIFVCLMDSKDYLQATQRILELKVKNMQQVATVLVEVCTLEPNFNPYYPFVAAKMASLIPKFRLYIQYALWDHLKLLRQYELRRTSNLAKFAAKIIADPVANCSLSLLKFYPDLSNVEAIDRTFLDIFFGYFLKKVKKEYLSKLISKLRQDNNRDVKLGIQQYLGEFEGEQAIEEKLQICRRLLAIQLDERKMEMNDEHNQ